VRGSHADKRSSQIFPDLPTQSDILDQGRLAWALSGGTSFIWPPSIVTTCTRLRAWAAEERLGSDLTRPAIAKRFILHMAQMIADQQPQDCTAGENRQG